MSALRSPTHKGFAPLAARSNSNDATIDIPLEPVQTHTSQTGLRNLSSSVTVREEELPPLTEKKSGLFHRHKGRRRIMPVNSKGQPVIPRDDDDDGDTITRMGMIYTKILNFSVVTRYFIYILPLGLALMVPILVGAFAAKKASIGGVRIVWLFVWFEIVWCGLWVSKLFVHFLPSLFQFLAGVVSSGTRKYATVLKSLEFPLTLAGWALISLATFVPVMTRNPTTQAAANAQKAAGQTVTATTLKDWQNVVLHLLSAAMASSLIFLGEKIIIQLIGINYHRKQFGGKIKDSKRNIYLLSLLYDASRALFPAYCNEFSEEDYIINDSLGITAFSSKGASKRASGVATPMRLMADIGRLGDKVTSVFGNVAQEITGKQVFNPNSAHSIVVEALEKTRSSEALARRLWMSFVVEGKDALFQEDIVEVLGRDRQVEAEECFGSLDRDNNGDISLDEMILTVTEFGRERKSIAKSMHDVGQAIRVLDNLLGIVVFVICVFVFIGFLNRAFVTTLATAGTALLSLSFVFAVTCQEVLGSCIFLFVKHPYDVGDRVDIKDDMLTVESISLLYTVFKRVNNGKMCQIPNIVLNTLWIENVSRSKAMREQLSIFANFDTSFEDIQALKAEMQAFVLDKDNSRDFQPEVEVECIGIAELNKLELRIEIRHKSNWANETVRAMRRSKFMCALVLALRKVPIYAPGGGDAALGDAGKPSFSVAISAEQAQAQKDEFAAKKEAKRLIPTKKDDPPADKGVSPFGKSSGTDYFNLGAGLSNSATDALNSRDPARDPSRDDALGTRMGTSGSDTTLAEIRRSSNDSERAQAISEVSSMLHRESTRGKRKAGGRSSTELPSIPDASPIYGTMSTDYAQRSNNPYSPTHPGQQSSAYNLTALPSQQSQAQNPYGRPPQQQGPGGNNPYGAQWRT